MARLVAQHRAGRPEVAGRFTIGALACGGAFAAVKAFEWTHLALAGHGPASTTFFTWFFVLTGLHMLHLLIGVAAFSWCGGSCVGPGRRSATGSWSRVATYWHLVDLLWLVIFPLLYFGAT